MAPGVLGTVLCSQGQGSEAQPTPCSTWPAFQRSVIHPSPALLLWKKPSLQHGREVRKSEGGGTQEPGRQQGREETGAHSRPGPRLVLKAGGPLGEDGGPGARRRLLALGPGLLTLAPTPSLCLPHCSSSRLRKAPCAPGRASGSKAFPSSAKIRSEKGAATYWLWVLGRAPLPTGEGTAGLSVRGLASLTLSMAQ